MLEAQRESTSQTANNRPIVSCGRLRKTLASLIGSKRDDEAKSPAREPLPKPSARRLSSSLEERPFELGGRDSTADIAKEKGTVLYLAYGSNLSYETLQKRRAVKPLAQVNVLVPELRLTFDLPGIPYAEPCFANSARREPENAPDKLEAEMAAAGKRPDYHKDRWKKGMVGVVYEVTSSDYAHIIATEGPSYQDIMVTCYPLPDGSDVVPDDPPSVATFRAHTLFAPTSSPSKPGTPPPKYGRLIRRPDPGYAQPSARYMGLLRDGADEHALPEEYKAYLRGIRPYTITTQAQRLGQFVFLCLWAPFIALLFALQRVYQDKQGKSPKWLNELGNALFASAWRSYDGFFKPLFGDGERTIDRRGRDEEEEMAVRQPMLEKVASWSGRIEDEEVAKLEDLARESLLD